MKRRAIERAEPLNACIGDVKRDFTQRQLEAIGAIAMQYNEAESWIDALLDYVTNVPDALSLDVRTRINGVDGKIAIIKKGARQYSLPEDVLRLIGDTLGSGNGGFALLMT